MKTKKSLFSCATLALVLLALLFGIGRSYQATVNAEENTDGVFLKISSTNLSFDDNIYIYFRTYYDGIDISSDDYGIIFWKTEVAEDERTFENAKTLAVDGSAIIIEKCDDWQNLPINTQGDKKDVATYKYKVAAKEMADVIYAEPYALKGGVYYYGKTIEYSVAAYASRKLGFYHGVPGSTNENFINLLNAMVNYGTLAQKYFNYNVENLMSDVVSAGKHATLTHMDALAPTCTEKGHAEYWKCECGQLFADANGKTTLEAIPTIAPLGHNYVSGICSRCKDVQVTDLKYFSFTLLNDGTYSIKANPENKSSLPSTIQIPKSYDNKAVTVIADSAFSNCSTITNVCIPDGIIKISNSAFYECNNLVNITIPDSVTTIDSNSFYNCDSLVNIVIPKNITSIGLFAFAGCNSLITTNYCGDIESWCKISFDTLSNPLQFSKRFLINGEEITQITIPDSITEIKQYTFIGYKELTDVSFNNNITHIGVRAFSDCNKLTNFVIPNSVKEIEDYAFSGCRNLTNIIIPENVTKIKKYAFSGCTELVSLKIGENIESIDNTAFTSCDKLEYVTIPTTFASVIPTENLKVILFNGGTTLFYTFRSCKKLHTAIFSDSVQRIVSGFRDCFELTTVTLGRNINEISTNAFNNCPQLIEVCNLSNLSIFKGSTSNGSVGYYAKQIITQKSDSALIEKDDFLFYDKNSTSFLLRYDGTNSKLLLPIKSPLGNKYEIYRYAFDELNDITSVTILEGVTAIGDSAFYNCTNLKSVSIPKSIVTIGKYAFRYTALENITIPEGVKEIFLGAFMGCTKLTAIQIPSSLVLISDKCFADCIKVKQLLYLGTIKQWDTIVKGKYWDCYFDNGNYYSLHFTVKCTDGIKQL